MEQNQPPKEQIKVNLSDIGAIKKALDESVVGYFLEKQGYEEDLTISNWKIILGGICCILGAISHYAPIPFPKNYYLLMACVGLYGVCQTIMTYIAKFVEKDNFFFSKPQVCGTI
jgi:hypothetical protein